MSRRYILLSALIWAIIWAGGGWLFGRFETGKSFSWLIGMPFYLPVSMAIWGTVRAAVVMRRAGGSLGAILGMLVGGMAGVLGFLIFMRIGSETDGLTFKNVPEWLTVELIWTLGGFTAGGLAGGVLPLVERMVIRRLA
jgi:hypothetical protein